ncbi:MAG: lipid-binding SYLF domain-containing protein [Parvularcula sp.]|jgi:lipid-binding SYLF domain-containing protein|nr:lipid-binding SYLF domain-containing protein [Parvularcula sp.]
MLKMMGATALAASFVFAAPAHADEEDGAQLLIKAQEMMDRCAEIDDRCGPAMQNAAGVLVFPEVLKADLIVGGAGGNGVLMVDGEPAGFYDIGKASVGLQAGIDESAVIYVFETEESLADLTDGDEWEMGISAGATVIKASADARAETGDPAIFVFDADGLNVEFNVNALRIWEDEENMLSEGDLEDID